MNYKGRQLSTAILFTIARQGIKIILDQPVIRVEEYFEADETLVVKTSHGFEALCGPLEGELLGTSATLLSKVMVRRIEDLTQAEHRPAVLTDVTALQDRFARPASRYIDRR